MTLVKGYLKDLFFIVSDKGLSWTRFCLWVSLGLSLFEFG